MPFTVEVVFAGLSLLCLTQECKTVGSAEAAVYLINTSQSSPACERFCFNGTSGCADYLGSFECEDASTPLCEGEGAPYCTSGGLRCSSGSVCGGMPVRCVKNNEQICFACDGTPVHQHRAVLRFPKGSVQPTTPPLVERGNFLELDLSDHCFKIIGPGNLTIPRSRPSGAEFPNSASKADFAWVANLSQVHRLVKALKTDLLGKELAVARFDVVGGKLLSEEHDGGHSAFVDTVLRDVPLQQQKWCFEEAGIDPYSPHGSVSWDFSPKFFQVNGDSLDIPKSLAGKAVLRYEDLTSPLEIKSCDGSITYEVRSDVLTRVLIENLPLHREDPCQERRRSLRHFRWFYELVDWDSVGNTCPSGANLPVPVLRGYGLGDANAFCPPAAYP